MIDHFNKIIKYLKRRKINFKLSYDKNTMYLLNYPKDIRIHYTDVEVSKDYNLQHTNIYRYEISWVIWNDRNISKTTVFLQEEAISIVKDIIEEFGLNNYIQQKLEF